MKRRTALKVSLGSLGICLTGASLSAVLYACKQDQSETWVPKVFNPDQAKLVTRLIDLIIPATDGVPGAIDANVHKYLDEAVADYFLESDRLEFLAMIDSFQESVVSELDKKFTDLKEDAQMEVMQAWADSSDDFTPSQKNEKHGFIQLRELTKQAFFTSEIGCKEVLNYDPVPGEYLGCTELPENGAAWARLGG